MIDLSNQHVFIAGGSRGIGRAAAIMAAKAGAAVSVNYLSNSAAAHATVDAIVAAGGRAAAFQADVAQEGAAERAIDAAVATLGPLTGVVVSAGIFEGASLEEMDLAFWNRTMEINLAGTFLTVKAAVPHLREQNGGSIVIYTSTAGQRGSDIFSAYATSKGAQILFMRSMAKELGVDQIRVNCIAPAWTDTDMAAPSLDALGRESEGKKFVLGRIGQPDDIAGPTVFLLSDLAKFVTGMTLTVDGGMDMRG
ncbi:MAG: SDR family NAD(P)-dependent oxidoreductase [Armatimonadetes bacterium]|nr:SDR family NAD(P)-dependent oxidoreductase [Armatimonadota bacterium]